MGTLLNNYNFFVVQVLGIKKPKNEVKTDDSFRKRSSSKSTQFYKEIKSVMRKESLDYLSDHGSGDGTVNDDPASLVSTNVGGNVREPLHPVMVAGVDHFDLLYNNIKGSFTGADVNTAPDVLGTTNGTHAGSIDLIDFGAEITPVFNNQPEGSRDSAISTSSSTRLSSFSSNRSSGLEFSRGSSHFEVGHDNITEEDSGFDLLSVDRTDSPSSGFRPRSKEVTDGVKRRSTLSRHGSTSSGTITGAKGEGSNRDSQASFLSFGDDFPAQSGSSSAADEDRETTQSEKKSSRAASFKRRFKRKSKLAKGSFNGEDDLSELSGKKDKGFFKIMKKGRSEKDQKASKTSGARVYEKLSEKTLDGLGIDVEVKTTKGKYFNLDAIKKIRQFTVDDLWLKVSKTTEK